MITPEKPAGSPKRKRSRALGNDPFERGAAANSRARRTRAETSSPDLETLPDLKTSSGPEKSGSTGNVSTPIPPSSSEKFSSRQGWTSALLHWLCRNYWRVQVEGNEQLPTKPVMLIVNHGGALPWDALMLRTALGMATPPRDIHPFVENVLPSLLQTFAASLGAVKASIDNAERLLGQGQSVAFFPEGTRGLSKPWSQRRQLQSFGRGGFVKLAQKWDLPIVPCAILGSDDTVLPFARDGWFAEQVGLPPLALAFALAPLKYLPMPSRWTVKLGTPIVLPRELESADSTALRHVAEGVRAKVELLLTGEGSLRGLR